jgi:hypothetical protein
MLWAWRPARRFPRAPWPCTFPPLWQERCSVASFGGQYLPYLPIIIPMGLLNLLASMQCVESAAAAGDSFSLRSSLAANGLCTFAAACFGSPFLTSIYIGHPAWKRMGARAGYSTLNTVFMAVVCFTGSLAAIGWAVPAEEGIAIVVWIGLNITVQAFDATPQRQRPAVIIGMVPVVISWATFNVKNGIRIATNWGHFCMVAAHRESFPRGGHLHRRRVRGGARRLFRGADSVGGDGVCHRETSLRCRRLVVRGVDAQPSRAHARMEV